MDIAVLSTRRRRWLATLRIIFGLVWCIDAYAKWQPAFRAQLVSDIVGAAKGQPALIAGWIDFWANIVKAFPGPFYALMVFAETYLAFAILFGFFTRFSALAGASFSLMVWSTAEGFGGPYAPGWTDIGTSIIYVFVFLFIFAADAGYPYGLDALMKPHVPRWMGALMSGPPRN